MAWSIGDKLRPAFRTQQTIFGLEPFSLLQCPAQFHLCTQNAEQMIVVPRLLDEIPCSAPHCFNRQRDIPPGRHHYHRNTAVEGDDLRKQIEALRRPRSCPVCS